MKQSRKDRDDFQKEAEIINSKLENLFPVKLKNSLA